MNLYVIGVENQEVKVSKEGFLDESLSGCGVKGFYRDGIVDAGFCPTTIYQIKWMTSTLVEKRR